MSGIQVEQDVDDLINRVNGMVGELPFLIAKSLTHLAKSVAKELNDATKDVFDDPVPFTQRAFTFDIATKQNLTSEVLIQPRQDNYLHTEMEGGNRNVKSFEKKFLAQFGVKLSGTPIAIPTPSIKNSTIRLNKYGNLTPNQIGKLTEAVKIGREGRSNSTKYWITNAKKSGKPGIFMQKPGEKRAHMIMSFQLKATYAKIFNVDDIVDKKSQKLFDEAIDNNIRKLLENE